MKCAESFKKNYRHTNYSQSSEEKDIFQSCLQLSARFASLISSKVLLLRREDAGVGSGGVRGVVTGQRFHDRLMFDCGFSCPLSFPARPCPDQSTVKPFF